MAKSMLVATHIDNMDIWIILAIDIALRSICILLTIHNANMIITILLQFIMLS